LFSTCRAGRQNLLTYGDPVQVLSLAEVLPSGGLQFHCDAFRKGDANPVS